MALVKLTPQAEEDLYQLWYFIAIKGKSPLNAERFIDDLTEQFAGLASNPQLGRRKIEYQSALYQFPYGHYLIFYRIITGGIEIVRVLHGARNIPELI